MKNIILALIGFLPFAATAGHRGVVTDVEEQISYRTICENYRVQRYEERVYREERRGPNILGAIVGGAIGSQIGSGSGRDIAIAAGAVAGSQYRSRNRYYVEHRPYTTYERQCRREAYVDGYYVTYRYRGRYYSVVLDYYPDQYIDHVEYFRR